MLNLLMAPMDVDLIIERVKSGKKTGKNCDSGSKLGFCSGDACSAESGNETRHLKNLGFVPGSKISIVNEDRGNLIVKVKDYKVAIDRDIARRILVRNL